jgi:hypothetical protein
MAVARFSRFDALLSEIEWRGDHRYPLSTRGLGSILQVSPVGALL